jgi:DNA polymerase III sliding clamp (beta) subunit (PCNA family)
MKETFDMEMLRRDLLEKLEIVAPALATNALLPILTHYCLTGKALMAFNDQIAIAVPFESDVIGAVPGQVLLSLVKSSLAKLADISNVGDTLLVKLASTKIKLAYLSPDNFAHTMPSKRKNNFIVKDRKSFLDALKVCMLSVGHDTSITDQLGVTLIPDEGKPAVLAFSTDNATIAHARIELPPESPPLKQRTILSEQFVKQVLTHGATEKAMHFEINSDYALMEVPGITLFGRLIVSTSPIDFVDIASRHFPKEARKKVVPIPTKLEKILDRAVIITDSMTDQAATAVSCDGDIMKFVSKTSRGEIAETMQTPGHPQVKTRLGPKLLRNGYGMFDSMLVSDGCMVMVKGNSFYMVSAFAS